MLSRREFCAELTTRQGGLMVWCREQVLVHRSCVAISDVYQACQGHWGEFRGDFQIAILPWSVFRRRDAGAVAEVFV